MCCFQKPGQRPAPVSARNGTALSRGLLGAHHELAALGIRVVVGRTTDPPLPPTLVARRGPE